MSFRRQLARYLRVIARYIEEPQQLPMRRYYFMPHMFHTLSQPWIQALKIATVLDIGANVGDFAFSVRPVLPDARIYSFEPLPECYQAMLRHMQNAPRFTAFNLALGDESGELTFQHHAFSPASSFLPMADAHKEAFPISVNHKPVTVKVERLDAIRPQLELALPLLVKLDVQGYEGHVLRGGEQTIRLAALIIVETSFTTLYESQPLFPNIYQTLTQWGFAYLGPIHQFQHPQSGRPLEEDSLFIAGPQSP